MRYKLKFDISDIPSDFEAEWMIQLNEIIESIEKPQGRFAEVFRVF